VNHYDRLKVTQDAPPEVIRAAYRALANRLHPDRTGSAGGPDDDAHTQMSALNTAYEVLIDPVLRRDYDATLAPARPTVARMAPEVPVASERQLERPWQGVQLAPVETAWAPGPKHILAGAGVGVILMTLVGMGVWHSGHLEEQPLGLAVVNGASAASGTAPTPAQEPGAPRRPTVEELARMSDEELIQALPSLDGRPAPNVTAAQARSESAGPHVLDGKPLALRVETRLVDPLAPEPARAGAKAVQP
jgi:DnaJ domain